MRKELLNSDLRMIIGILKEKRGENRVAMTPEIMKKLTGYRCLIECGAGELAGYSDSAFEAAGGTLETSQENILESADIVATVSSIDSVSVRYLKKGAMMVGMLNPLKNIEPIKQMARLGVFAFSLELLPRITRAQMMDVLSSQSNLAGYQSVIWAASKLGRAFPLMMTAAGSVPAAKVLVIGAGVAGLQAIATAKRLGAIVSAFDVRAAAKEQVESLGATFIEVASSEVGESMSGYAKEMSENYQKDQEAKLKSVVEKQDVIITTAQIPNRPAPKIITKSMVSLMSAGSLIIDLAGESGGNCELSRPNEEVVFEQKRIFSPLGIMNDIANTASQLYAANIASFIKTLFLLEEAPLHFNPTDDLIKHTLLTYDGNLVHPLFKNN